MLKCLGETYQHVAETHTHTDGQMHESQRGVLDRTRLANIRISSIGRLTAVVLCRKYVSEPADLCRLTTLNGPTQLLVELLSSRVGSHLWCHGADRWQLTGLLILTNTPCRMRIYSPSPGHCTSVVTRQIEAESGGKTRVLVEKKNGIRGGRKKQEQESERAKKTSKMKGSNKEGRGSGGETIISHGTANRRTFVCLSFSPSLSGASVMAALEKARHGTGTNSFSAAPRTHFRE